MSELSNESSYQEMWAEVSSRFSAIAQRLYREDARHTIGTFMSELSNESSYQEMWAEVSSRFSAIAQRL